MVQQAKHAGAWVFGGGLKGHEASVVATDGSVADDPYTEGKVRLGGIAVVDVPSREDELEWAAKIALSLAHVRNTYGSSCRTRPSKGSATGLATVFQ